MRKLLVLATVAAVAVLTTLAALWANSPGQASAQNADGPWVETRGGTDFIQNKIIFSTLNFYPGEITVNQGDEITFKFADQDTEPHTATFVSQEDLPDSVEEVFGCAPCEVALVNHFGGQFPEDEGEGPPQVPNPLLDEGAEGLDSPGDSLWFFPGESVSAQVSAPPGTTLYYVCAIHPWMQGSIIVQ